MLLSNESKKIARAFDRAALTYDTHCDMQQFSGTELIRLLDATTCYDSVIDLGCGTGSVTKHLLSTIHCRKCCGIDISAESLKVAKHVVPSFINLIEQDFDLLSSINEKYSLVFSNMALHWSSNFFELINKIHDILAPNGILLFSIPLRGTLIELNRENAQHFLSFQNVVTGLNDYHIIFKGTQKYTQTFSNTLEAIHSLKLTGVTHTKHRTQKGLSKILSFDLEKPELTYQIGFFMAKKKQ